MEYGLYEFTPLLLWSILCGIFLGAVYDIFRIRRLSAQPDFRLTGGEVRKRIIGKLPQLPSGAGIFFRRFADAVKKAELALIFCEDIVFSLIAAITLTLLFYQMGNGEIRWYGFAGAAVGFFCWYLTFGNLIKRFAGLIISVLRTIFTILLTLTAVPICRLSGLVRGKIKKQLERRADAVYFSRQLCEFKEILLPLPRRLPRTEQGEEKDGETSKHRKTTRKTGNKKNRKGIK